MCIAFIIKISDLLIITLPIHQANWGVSSGHPLATQVGMDILAQGGNAMDAAIAISYAEGVVEPYACGIGGGGVALIYENSSKRVSVIDFREVAPYLSRRVGKNRNILFGIPGFVSGMELIKNRYGTLSHRQLLSPAIELAENGFIVDKTLEKLAHYYRGYKLSPNRTPAFYRNQQPIHLGDLITQRELAQQLKNISANGKDGFYSGNTGHKLAGLLKESGYQIGDNGQLKYRPMIRSPLIMKYKDIKLAVSPLPNGGPTFLEMIRLAEINHISKMSEESTFFLKMIRTMSISYQDRFRYLGDNLPKRLFILDPSYLKQRWNSNLQQESETISEIEEIEESTTHIVVVDRWGNWVSLTLTLGDFFGSGTYVNGFFLNNCLKKFSSNPASPNCYAPGKRPFSYISPCIVFDADNQPLLAMGSPGGRQIPSILLQVFMKYLEESMPLNVAVASPRFYLKDTNTVCFEKLPNQALQKMLQKSGYRIVENKEPFKYGSVQILAVSENGVLTGTADPRRQAAFQVRSE